VKVGDMVCIAASGRQGVIVEDHTMLCSHAFSRDEVPYRMGAMMVLVEGKVERHVYANLGLINEGR